MDKVRITAILEGELGQKVLATAKEQKRSKSAMLAIMAEDWYKIELPPARVWTTGPVVGEGAQPVPECEHNFAPQSPTPANAYRGYYCTKCGQQI